MTAQRPKDLCASIVRWALGTHYYVTFWFVEEKNLELDECHVGVKKPKEKRCGTYKEARSYARRYVLVENIVSN
jgi:hypothetical protein